MKTQLRHVLVVSALAAAPSLATGQTNATIAFDLEKKPIALASMPGRGVELNGKCYFAATTCETGRELFVATASGAALFFDIWRGPESSRPENLTLCGDRIYFTADDGVHGIELWVTDGTVAGTQLVADLEPGADASSPRHLVCCGNRRLFFTAFDCTAGRELHVTNGTRAGTRLVKDIRNGLAASIVSTRIVCCGNDAYFFADDGTHGDELWKTDGTAQGTVLVKDIRTGILDGVRADELVCCNGKVFFVGRGAAGDELFVSDGTSAGTKIVKDLLPGRSSSGPRGLTCCNGKLYFNAFATIDNNRVGTEPFVTDGTEAGTVLLKDIRQGSSGSFASGFTCCNGKVFFAATSANEGSELWVTDGSPAGTNLVKDIVPGTTGALPGGFTCCGGTLFFSATTPQHGRELWKTDGTAAGTVLVKDLVPGTTGSGLRGFHCCGQSLLFTAIDPGLGGELHVSDGTATGTKLLADIYKGTRTVSSRPTNVTCVAPNQFFFTARTEATGTELFFFDGTNVILHDIEKGTGSSSPTNLVWQGNTLFFSATTTATGREPFCVRIGGNVQIVIDFEPGPGSSTPREITKLGHKVVMSISNRQVGRELGIADPGTETNFVHKELRDGPLGGNPSDLTQVPGPNGPDSFVAFRATDSNGDSETSWTDGVNVATENLNPTGSAFPDLLDTPEGPVVVVFDKDRRKQFFTIKFDPTSGKVVFTPAFQCTLQGNNCTVTDAVCDPANADAYLMAAQENSSTGAGVQIFINVNGTLQILIRVNPNGSARIANFRTIGNNLFFTGTDGKHGTELFVFNFVTRKLRLLDILPGFLGSFPRSLRVIGCRLWFFANNSDISDVDIYSTDGTSVRKEIDLPSRIDQNTSAVHVLETCGGNLWFPAYAKTKGVELLAHELAGPNVERFGKLCGQTRPTADSSLPILGKTMTWTGARGPAGRFGVLFLDKRNRRPLVLAGCELWTDLATAVLMGVVAPPRYSFDVPLPSDVRLAGARAVYQTVWITPRSVLPITTTNAVLLGFGICN